MEANLAISGIFNISSGNYTVGEVADLVKLGVEEAFDRTVQLNIKNIQDYRNYKVSNEKAKNVLPLLNLEEVKQ